MLQYYTHHPFEHSNASTTSLTAVSIRETHAVQRADDDRRCFTRNLHVRSTLRIRIGMNQESKEKNVHLASFGRFFQSGAEQMNWRERG
uniref:Uncharacterized protein n=1 Tax=Setaria viridis TaxID=4556 RepID=A0A4U6VKV5_SETVI|nr:hypothetical protein SEVIR_3G355800v2 [Setaria viridis]